MAIQTIYFDGRMNISAQVGDYAFYLNATPNDDKSIEWSNTSPTCFGVITDVGEASLGPYIKVDDQDADLITANILIAGVSMTPSNDSLIMFAKDNSVNKTGVGGYYMEVTIKNDSTSHAEIFTLGSEISTSSK